MILYKFYTYCPTNNRMNSTQQMYTICPDFMGTTFYTKVVVIAYSITQAKEKFLELFPSLEIPEGSILVDARFSSKDVESYMKILC